MSKHEKTYEKLNRQPPPSDLSWDDLCSLMGKLGFKLSNAKRGSGRRFYHEGKDCLINCHEPHPSPNVDKGAVAAIAKQLSDHNIKL